MNKSGAKKGNEKIEEELGLLLSEKEIVLGDKEILVKRLSMLDTIRIASGIGDIVAKAMEDTNALSMAIGKVLFESEDESVDVNSVRLLGAVEIFGLIGEDGVEVLKRILVKSTNLNAIQVEELDLIEGIDLIFSVYEVNKGFFMKCGKRLLEKMDRMKEVKK